MVFSIITHVAHAKKNRDYYAYMPYVREMNLWIQNIDRLIIVGPLSSKNTSTNSIPYEHSNIQFCNLLEFDTVTRKGLLTTIIAVPFNFFRIFWIMMKSDHIHLRCPGNVGLLGSVVQILFPFKKKTTKYAGNWGENKGQPWSYRLQKLILSNRFLTHNMQVLVYGEWPNQSHNVFPFFTASYSAKEMVPVQHRSFEGTIRLVFVGALMKSKNPMLTIQIAEALMKMGVKIKLEMLGDGAERNVLEHYVQGKQLQDNVFIQGNVSAEQVKETLQQSHFLVFLSNSEGWPKAVAEAMFWGCVPLTKPVSCVPWMLANGKRGMLANNMDVQVLAQQLYDVTQNAELYNAMSTEGAAWSRQYTTEKFQQAIQSLL
jgi:glycosyltransferase involved in cell wall biosynthesis